MKPGFFAPTPDRYRIFCWTYNYVGHRTKACPTRWGLPPRSAGSNCGKCGQFGFDTKWLYQQNKRPALTSADLPLENSIRKTPRGDARTRNKRKGGPCNNETKEK